MAQVTFGNGARPLIQSTSLDGDSVNLTGTNQASKPLVTFLDVRHPHILTNITEYGSGPHTEAFGLIQFLPSDAFGITVQNGVTLSYGNLMLGAEDGGPTILDGTSWIFNDSTYTALGGRYQDDPTILNGYMVVENGSVADFSHAPLQGPGTILDFPGATVDVNHVAANAHVQVLGGRLVTQPGMSFLGTDYEAYGGVTDVLNSGSATLEVFNQTTGGLYLLNSAHQILDKMIFVGDNTLYSTPDGHGGMNITTDHHAGSLPAVFSH